MTSKITAAVAVAFVLATAGIASARPNAHLHQKNTALQSSFADSYYNKDYWDAIAPNGRIQQRDPFVGTYFEGVVPY